MACAARRAGRGASPYTVGLSHKFAVQAIGPRLTVDSLKPVRVKRNGAERELVAHLGHADPTASRRYQHTTRDRDRAITAGLDVILRSLRKSVTRLSRGR